VEYSPSCEGCSISASQEIPFLLWNSKVHYRVYNSKPLFPIQSYLNLHQSLAPYLFKIHFNTVPSTPRSSKWPLPLRFARQHSLYISGLHQGDTGNLTQAVSCLPIMTFLQRHRKASSCPFEGVTYSTTEKCP